MSDYSQGVAHDGAVILHHGIAMTPDEIVLKLNHYADLEQQLAERQWISVEDRLPEDDVEVLVYIPSGNEVYERTGLDMIEDGVWFEHFNNYENFVAVGGYSIGGDDCSVVGPSEKAPYTHWMPLPEPPQEQDK